MSTATVTLPRVYQHDPSWGALPAGQTDWNYVPAVAVDSQDRIYVNQRGGPSIIVYSRDGEILSTCDRIVESALSRSLRNQVRN